MAVRWARVATLRCVESVFFTGLCGLMAAAMFGLFVWGIVVAVRRARARERQKTAYLWDWARRNGWTYVTSDPSLTRRFQGRPFGQGTNRRALHVLAGVHRGRQMIAFEYFYTVSNGENSTTHRRLIAAIPTPSPRPYLELTLEGAGSKLLELVGVRDLQLESEEFNRVFRIRTGSDRFAYDVLHPRMMEWLLADQRSRTVPFRFEGNALLCWSGGEMNPQHVTWMADYLADVADRVPGYVWR